jgi:TatD DNase family protein
MSACIVPAVSLANCQPVLDCCHRYQKCAPAYGIHPLFTDQAKPEHIDQLAEWLNQHRAIAIGEIGLDGFVDNPDWDTQHFYFTEQLKLARQFDLPVILHGRKAIDAMTHKLRRFPVKGGIAHAFNGSRQQAEILIEMGFKLGFGGAMTYPGSTRIRHLATELPLSAMVLETDSPDVPPSWLGKQGHNEGRNEPSELPAIARTLADLRSQPVGEILAKCSENVSTVFGPYWQGYDYRSASTP